MKKLFRAFWPYGLVVLFLTCSYFLLRLRNLTVIPIFTDEAIYLRWAQIALGDPKWRFISLIDGKQPLFIWLLLPFLKFISDPLVAGRIAAVCFGFLGILGMTVWGWYLTKNYKGALISGLLYLLIPFFLMYDRLALYDGLLTVIGIWSLFFTYLLGKKMRLDIALILGSIIGAGLLTKSSAQFFWILLPLSLLFVEWKKKQIKITLIKWLGLVVAIIIQSQIYNNILLLSEFRYIVGLKNLSFIYSFSEFIKNPFIAVWGNLHGLGSWLISYLTYPLVFLILASFYWLFKKNWKLGVFFGFYFFIPFISLAFFGKVIYPRFLLFMVPPLLLPVVLLVEHIISSKKYLAWKYLLLLIVVYPLIFFDWMIITNPIKAPIPNGDRNQLINDWPAGYGIKEVVAYLNNESKDKPIVVGTDGTFGLYPMALELYFLNNKNITIKSYYPLNEMPKDLLESAKSVPTYLLFKEKQVVPPDWPIVLINEYRRGDGDTFLKFFRVIPKT